MNTQGDNTQSDAELDELTRKIEEQKKANEEEMKNIEESETAMDEKDAEIQKLTNAAKQAAADLANFRRRSEEEKKQFLKYANANVMSDLLQVVDNFDRALLSTPEDVKGTDWAKGIEGIDMQLKGLLQKNGVTEINAMGQKLDIQKHEALLQGPGEKDTVVEVLEKGYMMGDKVLRPAKVKVGNGE